METSCVANTSVVGAKAGMARIAARGPQTDKVPVLNNFKLKGERKVNYSFGGLWPII